MLQFLTIKSRSHQSLSSYSTQDSLYHVIERRESIQLPQSNVPSIMKQFLPSVSGYAFATENIFLAKFWLCCKVKS